MKKRFNVFMALFGASFFSSSHPDIPSTERKKKLSDFIDVEKSER